MRIKNDLNLKLKILVISYHTVFASNKTASFPMFFAFLTGLLYIVKKIKSPWNEYVLKDKSFLPLQLQT